MIAVIPARSGSKRIPRKNIREFHGKPIIAYSIQAALDSELFSRVIVSTDDDEFAAISMKLGADVHLRHPSLGVDDVAVGTVAVVQEVAREYPHEKAICAIYPCAPFITGSDIRLAFSLFMEGAPDYLYITDGTNDTDQGQFYWGLVSTWRDGTRIDHALEMKMAIPGVLDINTPDDWKLAEERYNGTE